MKPSEYIRRHLRGGFRAGHALDDLMTRRTGGIYDEVSARIVKIHEQFRTQRYPIGISNPDSNTALEELAAELEERGY